MRTSPATRKVVQLGPNWLKKELRKYRVCKCKVGTWAGCGAAAEHEGGMKCRKIDGVQLGPGCKGGHGRMLQCTGAFPVVSAKMHSQLAAANASPGTIE